MSAQPNLKRQIIEPARTSLGKYSSAHISEGVYVDPDILAELQGYNPNRVTVFYTGSYVMQTSISPSQDVDVAVYYASDPPDVKAVEHFNRALAESLCEQHPNISTDTSIFGGIPHLRGLRISVGDILGQLYLVGSVAAVQEIYAPDINEHQVKEAIAYAQDFLEAALSS